MISAEQKKQIQEHGISLEEAQRQIELITRGVDFMDLHRPATVNDGIKQLAVAEQQQYEQLYEQTRQLNVLKFVPASGAATRMFKELYDFLANPHQNFAIADRFAKHVTKFGFYQALDHSLGSKGGDLEKLLHKRDFNRIFSELLDIQGLNYGKLPKGLLDFHQYPDGARTPLAEHFAEGIGYAAKMGEVAMHLTVSPEHQHIFEVQAAAARHYFARKSPLKLSVSFSVQHPSTDTLALTTDNKLVTDASGYVMFRPGGHGALLQNLNRLQADLVFIKNIDNVVPDRLKPDTIKWKKSLGGLLIYLREQTFNYLTRLDNLLVSDDELAQTAHFCKQWFSRSLPETIVDQPARVQWFKKVLNRPIRVCGMVKNEGEPGGGPFWVTRNNEQLLQIVESSQVNAANSQQQAIFGASTHFNPVDLVCSLTDYRGNPFDLDQFKDPSAAFIVKKSIAGTDIQGLELPGLWNGAMSDWNTVFVEVPKSTFNPVKTVFDLLRPEHQA